MSIDRVELEEVAAVIAFVSDAVSAINNDDGLDRQSAFGASLTLTWVKDRIEALGNIATVRPD